MLYSEFLNIGNTLTEEKLDSILDAYGASIGYYRYIIRVNTEDKEKNLMKSHYKNQLFLYVYNMWKKDLINIYKENRFVGKYKEMAYRIIKYLEGKNPKTFQDVLAIINGYNADEETVNALNELKWNRIEEDSTWQFMHSRVTRFYQKEVPAEHRFYLNCNSTSTHKVVYEFIRECDQLKLPYRLKYDDFGNRSDTIVIWSNTKLLPKYMKILRRIKSNPELKDCFHKPPVLTGVIDGWIGFASEPQDDGKKKLSFNTKREKHLTTELEKIQRNYLRHTIRNKQYDFFRSILNEIINITVDTTIRYAKDEQYFYDIKGYRKSEVESSAFRRLVTEFVYKHQQDIVDYLLGVKDSISLKMPYKKSRITIAGINESTKKLFIQIVKNNPNIKKKVLEKLIKSAPDYEIDQEQYFFDPDKKELIEEAAAKEMAKREPTKTEEIKNNKPTMPKKETKTSTTAERVYLYTNEENNLFYVLSYDVTRYELHSACNPCLIGNKLCYRISNEDVKKLLAGENNSFSPYKVELVVVSRYSSTGQKKY